MALLKTIARGRGDRHRPGRPIRPISAARRETSWQAGGSDRMMARGRPNGRHRGTGLRPKGRERGPAWKASSASRARCSSPRTTPGPVRCASTVGATRCGGPGQVRPAKGRPAQGPPPTRESAVRRSTRDGSSRRRPPEPLRGPAGTRGLVGPRVRTPGRVAAGGTGPWARARDDLTRERASARRVGAEIGTNHRWRRRVSPAPLGGGATG
jgi:hypothetical protein